MLPRSLNEVYENIRDFFICRDKGKVTGVAALHILWSDLAEIRSVAVSKEYQDRGIGRKLIAQCLKEAKALGIKRVFALTYNPSFLKKFGFK
ncbi:MAG: GNAT family N-acetyltransferase, partial [Candidatus Mariimomonas ferrooxydans]